MFNFKINNNRIRGMPCGCVPLKYLVLGKTGTHPGQTLIVNQHIINMNVYSFVGQIYTITPLLAHQPSTIELKNFSTLATDQC